MLLKVVGQPLGTAKRVLESHWEMPKGYCKSSGQFLKGIGKPLGNAQIPPIVQKERRLNCPAAISKNVAISFSLKRQISVYNDEKSKKLWTILKMLSGSYPIFALFLLTIFCLTQTGGAELQRVETRLKLYIRKLCYCQGFILIILKGHHHKRSIKSVSTFSQHPNQPI
jgi:hypothetical protein